LDKYPELASFRRGAQSEQVDNGEAAIEATSQTPREVLEASYQVLRRELAQELLEQTKKRPAIFFV
jgi:restriction system protein